MPSSVLTDCSLRSSLSNAHGLDCVQQAFTLSVKVALLLGRPKQMFILPPASFGVPPECKVTKNRFPQYLNVNTAKPLVPKVGLSSRRMKV